MPTRSVILTLGAAIAFVALLGATYLFFPRVSSSTAPTPAVFTTSDSLVAQGAQLFAQYQCVACHTTDGSRAAGPTLKGLSGSLVRLDNGKLVAADDAYIRQSIVNPDAQVVKGWAPQVMGPAVEDFLPQINADHNLDALVAYIDSLK